MDIRVKMRRFAAGNTSFTIPELQRACGTDYATARAFVEELEREGEVVFAGGMRFLRTDGTMPSIGVERCEYETQYEYGSVQEKLAVESFARGLRTVRMQHGYRLIGIKDGLGGCNIIVRTDDGVSLADEGWALARLKQAADPERADVKREVGAICRRFHLEQKRGEFRHDVSVNAFGALLEFYAGLQAVVALAERCATPSPKGSAYFGLLWRIFLICGTKSEARAVLDGLQKSGRNGDCEKAAAFLEQMTDEEYARSRELAAQSFER